MRSSRLIPGARKALSILRNQRIPFILLTNGGGRLESERVKELSNRLCLEIDESIFIQSHTPYAQLGAEVQLLDKHILVIGGKGDKCRKVAQS